MSHGDSDQVMAAATGWALGAKSHSEAWHIGLARIAAPIWRTCPSRDNRRCICGADPTPTRIRCVAHATLRRTQHNRTTTRACTCPLIRGETTTRESARAIRRTNRGDLAPSEGALTRCANRGVLGYAAPELHRAVFKRCVTQGCTVERVVFEHPPGPTRTAARKVGQGALDVAGAKVE